jgi:hypothetical protein
MSHQSISRLAVLMSALVVTGTALAPSTSVSVECNWMEDWAWHPESGNPPVIYHAGYQMGSQGMQNEFPLGQGDWQALDMRAVWNYHEWAEPGPMSYLGQHENCSA